MSTTIFHLPLHTKAGRRVTAAFSTLTSVYSAQQKYPSKSKLALLRDNYAICLRLAKKYRLDSYSLVAIGNYLADLDRRKQAAKKAQQKALRRQLDEEAALDRGMRAARHEFEYRNRSPQYR